MQTENNCIHVACRLNSYYRCICSSLKMVLFDCFLFFLIGQWWCHGVLGRVGALQFRIHAALVEPSTQENLSKCVVKPQRVNGFSFLLDRKALNFVYTPIARKASKTLKPVKQTLISFFFF